MKVETIFFRPGKFVLCLGLVLLAQIILIIYFSFSDEQGGYFTLVIASILFCLGGIYCIAFYFRALIRIDQHGFLYRGAILEKYTFWNSVTEFRMGGSGVIVLREKKYFVIPSMFYDINNLFNELSFRLGLSRLDDA